MAIQVVILAAGQGKRMRSNRPKVLHTLAGKPLLQHVIETAMQCSTKPPIVVHDKTGALQKQALKEFSAQWIAQPEQLGTGHAVQQTLSLLKDDDQVLILYGDVPLISLDTLMQLITNTPNDALGMLTTKLTDPKGYGRILRDSHNKIVGVVEERDADAAILEIKETNSGIYLVPAKWLKKWLPLLNNENAQKEYYLTDIIKLAVEDHVPIIAFHPQAQEEILGVNDRVQLAVLERYYQRQQAEKLLRIGVTLMDPNRLDIRGQVDVGQDVMIDINVILEGKIILGNNVVIGANTVIRDTTIADNVVIKENCVIEAANLKSNSIVGPFARIRPGTVLDAHTHIGNFVEIKNSEIGEGSKVNHLSYIGDSIVGKKVNIGAGTITCNYDGANKHKTIIGDDVQIGSDTQLVAPVTIGEGATIAAGSTIIKNVPAHQLTVTQKIEQRIISNWQRPVKKE